MARKNKPEIEGGCTCKYVRYRMEEAPLFVNCCHCTWCQRESGSAFALNAMIESDRLTQICGTIEKVQTPTNSGAGQQIFRCPQCWVALWSYYAGAGSLLIHLNFSRLTYIFLPLQSSLGSYYQRMCHRCLNIMTANSIGLQNLFLGARVC